MVLVTIGIFYMCKGTTMGVGNHTFRYDSMRFDTIWFSSSSDAPRAWQAPRRRAHDARQLALSSASNGREIDHHSAHFLPREVGIRKFGSTYVRSKDRESMGTMGWCMSFETCESKRATHSSPRPRFGIFGAVVLLISYFIFFLCFKV